MDEGSEASLWVWKSTAGVFSSDDCMPGRAGAVVGWQVTLVALCALCSLLAPVVFCGGTISGVLLRRVTLQSVTNLVRGEGVICCCC